MGKSRVVKTAAKIALNILLYAFILICLFSVMLTIISKRDVDGTATIFGRQMRVVVSSSMERCDETDVSEFEIKDIPLKSMVFIETVPTDAEEAERWYASLKVGDVLTFKYVYVKQETITHRITDISENTGGGYTIRLEGDNKNADSETLVQTIDTSKKYSPNYIIGKVVGQSYLLGLVTSTMQSPLGLVFIVIIPSLIIVVFEVLKIVRMVGSDKRHREKSEMARQTAELEALKRRLAELEGASTTEISVPPDTGKPPTSSG